MNFKLKGFLCQGYSQFPYLNRNFMHGVFDLKAIPNSQLLLH